MASDYNQGVPNLIGLSGIATGSSHSGGTPNSDYSSMGTMQNHGMDALLGNSQAPPNGHAAASAPYTDYSALLSHTAPNMHAMAGPYDNGGSMSVHMQARPGQFLHRASTTRLQGGQSPAAMQQHRLSISSNGPYAAQLRQSSMEGSDVISPPSAHGRNSLSAGDGVGDNPFAGSNNDAVDMQNYEESRLKGDSQNPLPPWTELRTKAGKERKRLPLACIACRRKKIRCSGEKPACKHCLRSRIPCVYKVTARKAAPRTDYMAMLDKRLKRMEDRVIKIIPKEEQGNIANIARAVVKPALPPLPTPKNTNKKRNPEQAFGTELDDWAESRSASVPGAVQDPSGQTELPRGQDAEEHSLLQEGKDKLPTPELQEHLAEVFFDYVYGQNYHLLHKPSFMRKLAAGTVPPVLTLAVCAISARFSSHPAVRTEPAFLRGEDWASAAREIALRRYDTPNITILIVYLILGLHEFGTCQGGRSWMFGGMAQRMAYALQLHKDLDHDPKSQGEDEKNQLTFTDREIRRRTMWSCFLMDRFNSSGTDRPIFVNEQYIQAQLPIKEHYFQMEITGPTEDLDGKVPNPVDPNTAQLTDPKENMGVAAYLVRLVALWGRLVKYMNLGGKERDAYPMWSEKSTFQEIKRAADEWKDNLPQDLYYTPENVQNHAIEKIANQFIFLHIMYHQIVLFMTRFALPTPGARLRVPKDMPPEFLSDAAKAALESANQISALVHDAMDHLVVAPFAGYSAFFASTVHIHGAFSKDPKLEASSKQNLAWNVKYLAKMKKYWGMFHFVAENLKELYKRRADAARPGRLASADDNPAEKGQERIFQYGDWFDRYPHGVSSTDYEDPAADLKKEPGSDAVLGLKDDLQSMEEFFSKLSPPSRARKVAKKRQAKSDPKLSSQKPPEQNSNNQPTQPELLPNVQPEQYRQQISNLPSNVLGFANNVNYSDQSQSFPSAFVQPPSSGLMNTQQQQPGVLSQLDRHMVLSSYAGLNPSPLHRTQSLPTQMHPSSSGASHAALLDPSAVTGTFDMELSAFVNNNDHNGMNGYWNDSGSSSAWFMPFNMEPPATGDDNKLFNNGYDWHGFGTFADMGTGLTPAPPPVDMNAVQSGVGNEQNGGLDGLEGLR